MPGVRKTMREFKSGTLRSGSKKGPKVTSRKQAVAIALSEQRRDKAKPPWEKKNPAGKSKPLTAAQKRTAKARARKAGRPYPNLVDNMNAAKRRGK